MPALLGVGSFIIVSNILENQYAVYAQSLDAIRAFDAFPKMPGFPNCCGRRLSLDPKRTLECQGNSGQLSTAQITKYSMPKTDGLNPASKEGKKLGGR